MGKFALECPKCGTINTASNFIFAKKVIQCGHCKEEINVKESRLISKKCPDCGNTFIYDQGNKKKRRCPVCGKEVDHQSAITEKYKMVSLNCPQCACPIEVDKSLKYDKCPICDVQIDVEKELEKAKLVRDNGVSVIQYEGDNSTFIWKHPIEDFNNGSILNVHESQEAIFFMNGEALDTFGPGQHTLETQNIPILKKAYSLPTGSQTPFHAEVYFINQTVHMGMKWGTDSRVRFIDPQTGIPLDIGASGELNLQVSDSRRLLVKLVGTTNGLVNKQVLESTDEADICKTVRSFFRAPLMSEVKSHLAAAIKDQNINILEIDQYMSELSEALRDRISPKFEEYGLCIPQFYITNVSLPEDDPNFKGIKNLISKAYLGVKQQEVAASIAEAERQRKLIEAQTDAQLEMIKAQGHAEAKKTEGLAEAEVMQAKGYTQKDVIDASVQKAFAQSIGNVGSTGGGGGNGGGGTGLAGDLVGMMAQMKIADTMLDKMNIFGKSGSSEKTAPAAAPAAPAAPAADTWTCPECGESANIKKFCMNCGAQKPESTTWTCPECGETANMKKFCMNCGAPKPVSTTWNCPDCGEKDNKGKFCAGCGAKRPE